MDFLEAHKTLSSFKGGERLPFLMALSGAAPQLNLFLRAAAAKCNRAAFPGTLPFGTLAQALHSPPRADEPEVFLLLPWDFVPESDWRTGVPLSSATPTQAFVRADEVAAQLHNRPHARHFYIPAPTPPLFSHPGQDAALARHILALAGTIGATLIPAEAFSLGGYLISGCPISGAWMGRIADQIVESLLHPSDEPRKVLVTDLDNTLWRGVVSEDGFDGICCSPEGAGFRHFLYQTLLRKLQNDGVLIAAVSRNDPSTALAAIRLGEMVLSESDFVCVLASYHSKSSQIRQISQRLNLDPGSFVFVDDNIVELAEVSAQLPQVTCLSFPEHDDGLPELFSQLSRLFCKANLTIEDRERTELYRRRLAGLTPSELQGADLTDFLSGLRMRLTIHDRTEADRTRAVQLINKTNQFNLNGRRLNNDDLEAALRNGARIYTASLDDRTGSHGEIISCLLMADGTIVSWVMSCRVFQRRVEHAFLGWLAAHENPPKRLRFSATERNLPFQQFLQEPAFDTNADGLVRVDTSAFIANHARDLALFTIELL